MVQRTLSKRIYGVIRLMTKNKRRRIMKKTSKLKKVSVFICSVCSKGFVHKKPDTLVGKLGIIPVQFCKKCFPKVMAQSEELMLNDSRRKAA